MVFCPPPGKFLSSAWHLLHRHRSIEPLDDDRAAGKLDAFWNAFGPDCDDAGDDDGPRQHERVDAPAEEVVIRVLENVHMTAISFRLSALSCRIPAISRTLIAESRQLKASDTHSFAM